MGTNNELNRQGSTAQHKGMARTSTEQDLALPGESLGNARAGMAWRCDLQRGVW